MNFYHYIPIHCKINVKFGKRFADGTVELASFMKIDSGESHTFLTVVN